MDLLALGLREGLGLVMILASVPKLAARDEFVRAVGNYRLLPQPLVAPVSRLLAPFELAAGLALLVGVVVTPVALLVGVMLIAFAVAVAWNLLRGRRIDCGCAGTVAPRTISWPLVVRNLVLAAAALTLALVPSMAAPLPFAWPLGAEAEARASDLAAILITATLVVMAEALIADASRARSVVRRFQEVGA